ncbi:hypothetical protein PRIPAC_92655 [Pristionchus pacificus]|uniref:Uncharacterized protein n=1 Tax=Pristionchus pacificus TaxID=54126 RepID=A0A2A6BRC5_PRIPA|nr:hypothetical protein PRIPAC_92655 [Pristionchus pacificus]|eukprot:PDM68343.1 hypothetical protein PRIPAC_46387 [Pristionchus pacificus]
MARSLFSSLLLLAILASFIISILALDDIEEEKRGRNPYSWQNVDKRGRNPYSWMSGTKRARNPYSWMEFQKRARNPYSWME